MDQNRPAPFEDLTPRDIDVLTLVAEGLSNPEIAERLVLETSTVRWYVRQLYSKFQIDNTLSGRRRRQQLVSAAQQSGLVARTQSTLHPKHNLPAQTTLFIGRERELADLNQGIADPASPLITILGPGGMGKTRLALEVARQQLSTGSFADGVYFVPLQALSSADRLATAIGDHWQLPFGSDAREPKQVLLDFLRPKQLLLVLDNFEHLLAEANLLSEILITAPGIRLLVTSRERLKLQTETVFSLAGMTIGETGTAEPSEADAIRLFVQIARQLRSDLVINADNLQAITHICQLVGGMPLGIVLAAAWIETLTLAEIAAEIARSIDVLAMEMGDVPQRHWSIRAVFEPTWQRLSNEERSVYMGFAVFRGGCTREAAQAVTGATLRHLQTFVNKALLSRTQAGRYEMHELLRQYAETQLIAQDEVEAAQRRHLDYYLALAEEFEDAFRLDRGNDEALYDRLRAEPDNLRAALSVSLRWSDPEPFLRLTAELKRLWNMGHRSIERQRWLPHAEERLEAASPRVRARLLVAIGYLYNWNPDYHQRSQAQLAEAVAIFRDLGDRFDTAWTLVLQAGLSIGYPDEYEAAVDLAAEAMVLFQEMGHRAGMANVSAFTGDLAYTRGDLQLARLQHEEGLRWARLANARMLETFELSNLGIIAFALGDDTQAEALWMKALRLSWDNNWPLHIAPMIEYIATLFMRRGQVVRAIQLLSLGYQVRQEYGVTHQEEDQNNIDRYITTAREQLSPQVFDNAWTQGLALTLDSVVECILSQGLEGLDQLLPQT